MHKFYLLILTSFLGLAGFSQSINGVFDYRVYLDDENKPYVETYLLLDGKSLRYTPQSSGLFQAQVETAYIVSSQENILGYDKLLLKSSAISDTLAVKNDLLDIQQISFNERNAILETYILDVQKTSPELADASDYVILTDSIQSPYTQSGVEIAPIRLIQSYTPAKEASPLTKGNMNLIPRFGNYFTEIEGKIIFYTEIYGTQSQFGEGTRYVLQVYVENERNAMMMDGYVSVKQENATSRKIYLGEFDVANLNTGNYNLVVEVRDIDNKLVKSERFFFTRENPNSYIAYDKLGSVDIENTFVAKIQDVDSLYYIVRSFRPISKGLEETYLQNVVKNGDPDYMRQFIYSFWSNRNATNPEADYKAYMYQVTMVENTYALTNYHGYETDRGKTYLKYGAPNVVSERPSEPGSYPYEIWNYYKLNGQTNVRFIFYMPDPGTAQYELLHSDLRGEMYNPRWNTFLFKRNNSFNVDDTDPVDQYGNWSRDLYMNPR